MMCISKYKEIINAIRELIRGTRFEGKVYSVGGCERDKRLHRSIKDIDLVVALPNGGIALANYLHEIGETVFAPVVYEHFGTAMFCLKKFPDVELETVQTRKECYHDMESRNPETAYGTIQDDCTRRDFTVNAFYYDISNDKELDLNGNSENDLRDCIIRTCGDPEIIFNEDPLRVLRMVRFAAKLGFEVEEKTFECAKKYVDRLSIISRERIRDEFMKMTCPSADFYNTIDAYYLLWDLGAFKYIIPYLHKFGHKDVYRFREHMHDIVCNLVGWDNDAAFIAAMLYDDPDVEQELRDLKFTNDFIKEVMFYINTSKEFLEAMENEDYDENEMFIFRRFMHKCGSERRMKYMLLIDGDTNDIFFDWDRNYWDEGCLFNQYSKENEKFYTYKLPVDGNDVMRVLNIGPSKKVQVALDRLLNFVFVNPDHDGREDLLAYLEQIIKKDFETE